MSIIPIIDSVNNTCIPNPPFLSEFQNQVRIVSDQLFKMFLPNYYET